jgi:FkbM family methyltransferase
MSVEQTTPKNTREYRTHDGSTYMVDRNDFYFVNELSKGSIGLERAFLFLRDAVLATAASKGRGLNVLDVGAHIGTTAVPLAQLGAGKVASVHAFEADVHTFSILAHNVAANRVGEVVTCVAAAVGAPGCTDRLVATEDFVCDGPNAHVNRFGDRASDLDFNLGGLQVGVVIDSASSDAALLSRGVRAMTLDDACAHIPCVDFIKLDIEGAETMAVLGAQRMIERDFPVIYFERNYKVASAGMVAALGDGVDSSPEAVLRAQTRIENLPFIFAAYHTPVIALAEDNFLLVPRVPVDDAASQGLQAGRWLAGVGGEPFNLHSLANSAQGGYWVALRAGADSFEARIYALSDTDLFAAFYRSPSLGKKSKINVISGIFHGKISDWGQRIDWSNGTFWVKHDDIITINPE